MKTNLVILAAGKATRFKQNKLLYLHLGLPIIEHVFLAVKQVDFEQVIVVTQYPKVMQLAQTYNFHVVENTQVEKGISYSLQLGLQASKPHTQTMFLVGDQPYIQASTLQAMIKQSDGNHILCAAHQANIQNPIIFPKKYEKELLSLQGDHGGKQVVHRHMEELILVEVDKKELQDIDTKEDIL